jgi:hypothetical protein
MAYTYEWKLTGLKKQTKDGIEGAVVQTYWKVIATDEDGETGEFVGGTPFPITTVDPENFTPYDELTEESVLNWIKNYVSGSNTSTNYWPHISQMIEKQLDEKRAPILSVADYEFPWSSGSAASGSHIPY